MPSSISSLGIGSNLDLTSLLENLRTSEQSRLSPLKTQRSDYQSQLSGYGLLQNAVEKLNGAAEALAKPDVFRQTAVSAETDAFTVSADSTTRPGRTTVAVDQLAQAQSLVASGQAATDTRIGRGGTLTLSLGGPDAAAAESVQITLAEDDSTLDGIRDAINAADIGVDASIINDGSDTPYRLVLSSRETGQASQIGLSVAEPAGETALADLLSYASADAPDALTQTVAAQDARLQVNGVEVISPNNVVEQSIQGVTLSLQRTTESPVVVTGERDDESLKSAVEAFVSAYNNLQSVSNRLTDFDSESGSRGPLLGDATVRLLDNRVRSALNTAIEGSDYGSLAAVGISIQRDGTMALDESTFDTELGNDRDQVAALIGGDGTPENPGVIGTLGAALSRISDDGGLLDSARSGTERSIDRIGDSIERMQRSIDSTVERYRQQFVTLDSTLARLNSTSSYLTQQLAVLGNNNNGNNASR